jgi:tripartite-type tricarboxylate transporter receptor subunit TctC
MPVLLRATLTAIAMLWGSSASAQNSSNRDVNLIVAGGSGSAVDQAARALASALSPILRGRVEIQNRPAVLAIREAAKAAPDGRTLFVAPSTAIITAQMSQSKSSLEEALAPWSELAPVSLLATNSWALVVNRNSPWKDLTDFLTAAATSRQPINLGFTGAGNSGGPWLPSC